MADYTVDIATTNITVELAVGAQGPQGPAGAAGGSTVTYPAGENLSAGRAVIIDGGEAFYFQPNTAAHQGRAYGITTAAATTGNNATIQIIGEIENAAFTFSADTPLFVFTNGIIVDSEPATTILQSAGVGADTGKMRIDLSLSILKS